MHKLLRHRIAIIVSGVVLVLTGCSSPGSDDVVDNQSTLRPDDLRSPEAKPWDKYEVVDNTHIRVWYWGGDWDCYGWSADVVETTDSIKITVLGGMLKGTEDKVCDMGGTKPTYDHILLETDSPVGDRKIVNAGPAEDDKGGSES